MRAIVQSTATPVPGARPLRLIKATALNVARGTLLLAALLLLVMVRGGVPPHVYALTLVVSLGAVVLIAREKAEIRLWAAYILLFVLFAHLRTQADELGIAVRYGYVVDAERALGLGAIPTVWLQDHLYRLGRLSVLDVFALLVYFSYFIVPHLMAIAVWRSNRERFPLYVAALLGTWYAGLVISFLAPTAPPWMAGQTGHIPHVFRVIKDVSADVSPGSYQAAYETVGPNDVAAMPSLHMAATAIVALMGGRLSRKLGVLAWTYAAAMAFALVYLGEHYLADLLAGVAIAGLVWRLAAASALGRQPRVATTRPSGEPLAESA
jgi:membrane-associated phospholipid phosphatase